MYLVFALAVTALYAFHSAQVVHPWIDGEWLINYSGGLVRRGLVGAVLLGAARTLHLPLMGLTLAVQVAAYALFFWCVWLLTAGVRWSWPLVLALLSPATIAFSVLDPPSAVRKEVLLFVAVALLGLTLVRGRRAVLASALLTVAAPVLVFSHEALVVFFPYLFAPFFVLLPWRQALRLVMLPAVLAGVALVLVAGHPGDLAQAETVCQTVSAAVGQPALLDQPNGICGGAIAYLGRSPAEARNDTRAAERAYHYTERYPIPALLALLPLAWLLRDGLRSGRRQGTRWIVAAGLLAGLASIALFLVARDWGRWINIHVTCLLLLALLVERPAENLSLPWKGWRRALAVAGLLLYATAWTLPAVGIYQGRYGYLDLVYYMNTYGRRGHLMQY